MGSEKELHEHALQLAENALKRGFDVEAYICKYIAENRLNELDSQLKIVDRVPESDIDEQIDDINGYFVQYMKTKSRDDLDVMLLHIHQMLTELYHTCEDPDSRELFGARITNLTSIVR